MKWFHLVLLCAVACTKEQPPTKGSAPLIVLASFDTTRADAIGAYGDPDAVPHGHLSAKFIEIEEKAFLSQDKHAAEPAQHGSREKAVGLPNIVTSILASYRGYDTFGEAAVIFTATIGVMLLLRTRRREKKVSPHDRDQMETTS